MSGTQAQIYVITVVAAVQPESIVDDLQDHGLRVKQVLAALGQIIGEGSEQAASAVRALDAVESVDAQRTYRALGDPPDEDQP
ncbi:hypothetical protein [Glutamicibacter mishrai]|uniref:hypothetical protein n=1 Tax=Glutamicibacter mishrai TaxID=1775880 RepID=UPI003F7938A5